MEDDKRFGDMSEDLNQHFFHASQWNTMLILFMGKS
jgi:hypothetical protein